MRNFEAPAGPYLNFDGQKFSRIVCFVGKDIEYSVSAIRILLSKNIPICAIIGESAELIISQIPHFKSQQSVTLISTKRPWLDKQFSNLSKITGLLGINCGFDFIIPKDILIQIPILNLHPSALPFNRGCHHSFWALIENTPLGATLHWMSEGIDEGPIIAQITFPNDEAISADFVQKKCNDLCLHLLELHILSIMDGKSISSPQTAGTYHSKSDIFEASTLYSNSSISVNKLFDLCRATKNKGNGFYIKKNGRKYRITISTIEEIASKE